VFFRDHGARYSRKPIFESTASGSTRISRHSPSSERILKGAYRESKAVAYQKKSDVDAAYATLVKRLLERGHYPAIATHDVNMINVAREHAARLQLGADSFEFQMLYGIRRDLQASLVKDGYRVRVYVPFGRQWFPYFMRRLGERPANLGFVLRGITSEGR